MKNIQDLKHGHLFMLHPNSVTARKQKDPPRPFLVIREGSEIRLYDINNGELWYLNSNLEYLQIPTIEEIETSVKMLESTSDMIKTDNKIAQLRIQQTRATNMLSLFKESI